MHKYLLPLLVVLTLGSGALAQTDAEIEVRAKALETRLISPCCAHQTLDIHRSPEADRMKAEIRARLTEGETEEQLLTDFEARYGPDIIAQRSADQGTVLGASLAGVGVLGAVGVVVALRRWRRRSDASDEARQTRESKNQAAAADDELDERLRAELRSMDD